MVAALLHPMPEKNDMAFVPAWRSDATLAATKAAPQLATSHRNLSAIERRAHAKHIASSAWPVRISSALGHAIVSFKKLKLTLYHPRSMQKIVVR
jgi:hypothetical protein